MNHNLLTPWMLVRNLIEKLKIGDLVEIKRHTDYGILYYSHWGIYIGIKNNVYRIGHLTNEENDNNMPRLSVNLSFSSISSGGGKKEPICIDNLFDVCRNDPCRINNSKDEKFKPLPAEVIYNRVIKKIGNSKYSTLENNCEHYAMWCRYDVSISKQANVGKAVIAGIKTFLVSKSLLQASAAGVLEYVSLGFNDSPKKHLQ